MNDDLPAQVQRAEQLAKEAHDWLFRPPRGGDADDCNAARLREILATLEAGGRGARLLKGLLGFLVLVGAAAAAVVTTINGGR